MIVVSFFAIVGLGVGTWSLIKFFGRAAATGAAKSIDAVESRRRPH